MFPSLWRSVGLAPGLALCLLSKISWEGPWMDSESTSEGDEVAEVLDLATRVMPKLELVLQKLDSMEKKLDLLERLVEFTAVQYIWSLPVKYVRQKSMIKYERPTYEKVITYNQ